MGEPVSRHPLSWLRDVISRGDSSREGSTAGDTADPEVERRPVRLFECADCETTYIGVDKGTCSQCDGPVREIPSEEDLRQSRSEGRRAGQRESQRPRDR